MGERRLGEVRAADRPVARAARRERRLVQRPPQLAQRAGHPLGARDALGAVVGQRAQEIRVGVVDPVADDVQVLAGRIGRRDLHRRDHRDALRARGVERLGDASTVSWSLSARTSMPAAAARRTTSAGARTPSE
jgi:hypothetical protein